MPAARRRISATSCRELGETEIRWAPRSRHWRRARRVSDRRGAADARRRGGDRAAASAIERVAAPDLVSDGRARPVVSESSYRGADGFVEGWRDWLEPVRELPDRGRGPDRCRRRPGQPACASSARRRREAGRAWRPQAPRSGRCGTAAWPGRVPPRSRGGAARRRGSTLRAPRRSCRAASSAAPARRSGALPVAGQRAVELQWVAPRSRAQSLAASSSRLPIPCERRSGWTARSSTQTRWPKRTEWSS